MARAAGVPTAPRSDPVQALQPLYPHQSVGTKNQLLARYRASILNRVQKLPGVFVMHTVTFLKSGRASVGVMRQAVTGARKKSELPNGGRPLPTSGRPDTGPLALRLFLPSAWLSDEKRIQAAGVPEPFRRLLRKSESAMQLPRQHHSR